MSVTLTMKRNAPTGGQRPTLDDLEGAAFIANLGQRGIIRYKDKNYCRACYEVGDVTYIGINSLNGKPFAGVNHCSIHHSC